MIIKELIEKLKNANYLTDEEKDNWLNLIPYMSIEELRSLAYVLVWQEENVKRLCAEKDLLTTKLLQMFTAMNKHAVKSAKKEAYKTMEINERDIEAQQENELLKQLNDG